VIDWFTVSAQIINFLILVFLLKKFLYGPIIRAMDKREEKIAGRLNDAGQKQEEAQKEIKRYRKKNEDFESQRAEMLAEAKTAAEQQEKQLIAMARKEIDDVRARWLEAVSQEKEAFLGNLRKKMAAEIYSIARKVFTDLADMSLDYRCDFI
jgi:F-type H+-transporting ATPase subunit b